MATPPRFLHWRHRQAALWTALGWKTYEIAARLRVSPCTLRHWRTAPAFRAEVERAAAEIRQTVIALAVQEIVGGEPVRLPRGQGEASPRASLRRPRIGG